MPPRDSANVWPARLALGALILAGYGLMLLVFYPGVMTYDAKFVYEDIPKSVLGDWQSPAMTVLWRFINPIAPGAGSMFLLIITAYWLAFGTLAFALARQSVFARIAASTAGADAAGFRLCRDHLAGRLVFGYVAAGRFDRLCCG